MEDKVAGARDVDEAGVGSAMMRVDADREDEDADERRRLRLRRERREKFDEIIFENQFWNKMK